MSTAPRVPTLKRLCSAAFQIRCYSAPSDLTVPPAKQKYVPTSGTYPKGFLAGAAHAGVKPSNTSRDDIALVVSETLCSATAVFTKNVFKAAPVLHSRHLLKMTSENYRGVVVNSGNANAVTGRDGRQHAEIMAVEAAKCFDGTVNSSQPGAGMLVMSTGVIGQKLPIDKITSAIPKAHHALGSTHEHWLSAAKAICTTDTFPKLLSRTFSLPSHPNTRYSIAGMTKGAGMIHPNMGTLLGIICTDAKIDPGSMYRILRRANNYSFNCITVDGDTSTNDTVAFFANGAAAPPDANPIYLPPLREAKDMGRFDETQQAAYDAQVSEDTVAFRAILRDFMTDLAQLVVRDGEGATKFVTIRVTSDLSPEVGKRVAMSIAQSALVKTALYGKDANWGRILCAIGYAFQQQKIIRPTKRDEIPVSPKRTSVSFIPADGTEELKLLVRGEPEQVDEQRAKKILEMEDLTISVRLEDDGDAPAPEISGRRKRTTVTVWTCDFSHEYVTINADYRT